MADDWCHARGNKKQGPFAFAELRRRAIAGRLLPADLVWVEGMGEWSPARDVPGLFPPGRGATKATPIRDEFDGPSHAVNARDLLDLDFTRFITVRIISILWVLWLVVGVVLLIGSVILAAFVLPVVQWLLAIVGGLLALALYSVLIRVGLETLVVIFRISEDLGRIRAVAEARGDGPNPP